MQILEDEIQLREETRSLEQARPAIEERQYEDRAFPQAATQEDLAARTRDVVEKILELEEPHKNFGKEMALLNKVAEVMDEARNILSRPDTGPDAVAAETEAIELLLMAKRIKPGGGGGGGNSPGGGGGAKVAERAALALIGDGDDDQASVEDREVGQATGKSGKKIPEEFRTGLDAYFNALENGPVTRPSEGGGE